MNLKSIFGTLSRSWLVTIAIAAGLLTLLGYFFTSPTLTAFRVLLLNLAVILTGFAVFVGVANLINVHAKKIRRKEKGSSYSTLLIIFLVITFVLGLVARFSPAVNSFYSGAFNYIQLPVEASLMGLLTVTLIFAAIRLLRRRLNWLSVVFLVTALLFLFFTASLPFLGDSLALDGIARRVLSEVFATSGARGILLGVGLGTLAVGLRILFGADRPYGGK